MNDFLFVEVGLDATTEDLTSKMMVMKAFRQSPNPTHILLVVDGFNGDQRELYEIQEVREFCRKLVEMGFVSFLTYSTLLEPNISRMARQTFGAFETWLCAENKMRRQHMKIERAYLEEFDSILEKSNEAADAAVGSM